MVVVHCDGLAVASARRHITWMKLKVAKLYGGLGSEKYYGDCFPFLRRIIRPPGVVKTRPQTEPRAFGQPNRSEILGFSPEFVTFYLQQPLQPVHLLFFTWIKEDSNVGHCQG